MKTLLRGAEGTHCGYVVGLQQMFVTFGLQEGTLGLPVA